MLDSGPNEERPPKWLWIALGTLCLIVGIIGLVTPILPGTILIIAATALYAKSSRRIYNWLRNHKWLGKYVRKAEEEHGISWKVKIWTIGHTVLCAIFNVFILFKNSGLTLKIASIAFALIIIGLIIFFVPTSKK
jgi:uncharacterized membrane protein YbaN (DUF454 family)